MIKVNYQPIITQAEPFRLRQKQTITLQYHRLNRSAFLDNFPFAIEYLLNHSLYFFLSIIHFQNPVFVIYSFILLVKGSFAPKPIILYSQNQPNSMNPKKCSLSHRFFNIQTAQSDKGWAQSLPLQEKNHNINHAMSSTIYKSITKKNQLNKKRFYSKFLKLQQGQIVGKTCLNLFKNLKQASDKENINFDTSSKGSNIELLKRQIQYLEQNDFDNEKFPIHTPTLSKNESFCMQNHLKDTEINFCCKLKVVKAKPLNGSFLSTSKNLTLSRERPGTSENKEAKKYFSSKKKQVKKNAIQINECQPIIHNKNHNKFELIAPFRKYFQSKRNRQNKSCNMKLDQIYGKKLNKLVHLTLEGN